MYNLHRLHGIVSQTTRYEKRFITFKQHCIEMFGDVCRLITLISIR